MIDSLSISFDPSEQIRLSINRFENSTFISLFVHFRHENIAAIIRSRRSSYKYSLHALEFLFTNELGKPTERFDSDFVEPVLLLPARRAVPHSRPVALRGPCFWNRRQCFADASNQAFIATCYVFSPIASRLMGRTPGTHVLALCVHNSK